MDNYKDLGNIEKQSLQQLKNCNEVLIADIQKRVTILLDFLNTEAIQETQGIINEVEFLVIRNAVAYLLEFLDPDKAIAIINYLKTHEELYERIKSFDQVINALKTDETGDSIAHVAIKNGYINILQELFDLGVDCDIRNKKQQNVLHYFLQASNFSKYCYDQAFCVNFIEYMISRGCDVNSADKSGQTALHYAVEANNCEISRCLIYQGSDANIANKLLQTPLHLATTVLMAQLLIEVGKAKINVLDKKNMSALTIALSNLLFNMSGDDKKTFELVKYLITKTPFLFFNDQCLLIELKSSLPHDLFDELLEYMAVHYAFNRYHIASLLNDISLIDDTKKAFVNCVDVNGYVAVHFAISVEMLQKLISLGANVHAQTSAGLTILHRSSIEFYLEYLAQIFWVINDTAQAQMLMAVKNENKSTPLHLASKHDSLECLSLLLADGSDIVINEVNKGDFTALYFACKNGNFEMVKCLVEHNANVTSSEYDIQPLHIACKYGHLEIVKYLIFTKNDIYSRKLLCKALCNNNMTILHYAVMSGNLELVKYLIEEELVDILNVNIHNETPLHFASKLGYFEIVVFLLNNGFNDINSLDSCLHTPVSYALKHRHLDVFNYFLRTCEPNLAIVDRQNFTLLHYASQYGYWSIVRYLVEKENVNVNERNINDETPLHLASNNGHLAIVKYLVEHNANIYLQNNETFDALYLAVSRGHLEVTKYLFDKYSSDAIKKPCLPMFIQNFSIIDYLIDQEFDFNYSEIMNVKKINYLHSASAQGHLRFVEYLLDQGFDVDTLTDLDETPLHFASSVGHLEVVKLLVAKKADINKKAQGGKTSIDFAAFTGRLEILEYLIAQKNIETLDLSYYKKALSYLYLKRFIKNLEFFNKTLRFMSFSMLFEYNYETFVYLVNKINDVNVSLLPNQFITALCFASKYRALPLVKYLISKGADFKLGRLTSFYMAIKVNNLDVVKYFIQCGADVDMLNTEQDSPLHIATQEGHLPLVNFLLVNNANINLARVYYYPGETALHIASKLNFLPIVKCLIAYGASVDVVDSQNAIPLFVACQHGHVRIVDYFVNEIGLDINSVNHSKRTLLHVASLFGELSMVEFLITRGANIHAQDKEKFTSLHLASNHGHLNVVEYLVNQGADVNAKGMQKRTSLYEASTKGHLRVVEYLVNQGADINAQGIQKRIPLHEASANGHLGVVEYLVNQGADVNAEDMHKNTSLQGASLNGHLGVVEYLVSHGAKIDIQGMKKRTPLHHASFMDDINIVKYLVSNGANIEIQDEQDCTPLHLASLKDSLYIVEYLVNNGANIEAKDKDGCTPLHLAIPKRHFFIVEYLVNNGANIHAKDLKGQTPLDVALRLKNVVIVNYLQSKMAEMATQNQQNQTLHNKTN